MIGLEIFRYNHTPIALTIQDQTGIFSDIDIPYTLTQVEAYYPTSCSKEFIATAYWSVIIDDTTYPAPSDIITFTNPLSNGLFITRTYSNVTITSLTPGQTVTFVSPM